MEEDFYEELLALRDRLVKIQSENMDNSPMEIGDRVKPWDGSAFTELDGTKRYIVEDEIKNVKYFVVCSNTEKHKTAKSWEQDPQYDQDLIIADPETGKQYRTSSKMVKHV